MHSKVHTVINHHVISCPHIDHIIIYQCIHRYCSCHHNFFYLFLSWLHLNQCHDGSNDQTQLFDSVTFHNIDQMSTKSCSLGPFVCPDVQTPIEEPGDIFYQFKRECFLMLPFPKPGVVTRSIRRIMFLLCHCCISSHHY